MLYEYPLVLGYKWNLMQKISLALSIPDDQIYVSENNTNTYIGINIDITPEQKAQLDAIMAMPDPCGVPSNIGKTTYRLVDIWSMRQWFYAQIGMIPKFWFMDGQPDGSGECYIYIEFDRALTTTEKKTIQNTYAKMIGEVVI